MQQLKLLNENKCAHLKSIIQHGEDVLQCLILGYLVNQVAEDGSKLASNKCIETVYNPSDL